MVDVGVITGVSSFNVSGFGVVGAMIFAGLGFIFSSLVTTDVAGVGVTDALEFDIAVYALYKSESIGCGKLWYASSEVVAGLWLRLFGSISGLR